MASGTRTHSKITANVTIEIGIKVRGTDCTAFSPDRRVVLPDLPTYTHPDVTVICGPEQPDPRDANEDRSAMNPRLIVEVHSPSTESDDRGRKFERATRAESLQEYVLVLPDEPRVEVFYRDPGGTWRFDDYDGTDAVAPLRSSGIDLPLAEVYRGVRFETPAA